MKSIKEKAEEYVDDFYKASGLSKDECPVDVELTKADFEAGANYVLEEIEKCVKSSSNSRLKIDTIRQIIEQLKIRYEKDYTVSAYRLDNGGVLI